MALRTENKKYANRKINKEEYNDTKDRNECPMETKECANCNISNCPEEDE